MDFIAWILKENEESQKISKVYLTFCLDAQLCVWES